MQCWGQAPATSHEYDMILWWSAKYSGFEVLRAPGFETVRDQAPPSNKVVGSFEITSGLLVIRRPEPDVNWVFKFPGTIPGSSTERVGSMVLGSFP
jgi:hypothetical protein